MRISTETSDAGAATNREACSADDTNYGLGSASKGPGSITTTYLDWCYQLCTNWILWCLIGDISKEETQETTQSSTVLSRIDSGIETQLLRGIEGHPTRPAVSNSPLPIRLTLIFEDATITKSLDYCAYSQWININALLHEVAQDGIVVRELWDVNEDMQIGSGDWDARIHPGSVIDAWCSNGEESCDWDRDSSQSEDEVEGVRGQKEYEKWWFARWRERVEREGVRREGAVEGPSWFMTVIWCMTIVAGIVVFSLVC